MSDRHHTDIPAAHKTKSFISVHRMEMGYILGERWQARHKGGSLVPSLLVSQYIMQFMAYLTNSASRNDPRLACPEKAFLTGSNSMCRSHIHQHYEYYSKHCKEEGIEEAECCIPLDIIHTCKSKNLVQSKLNMVGAESGPQQFSCEGILCTITKFVACDDQVCSSCTHDEP